jgi:hypothetical protein
MDDHRSDIDRIGEIALKLLLVLYGGCPRP